MNKRNLAILVTIILQLMTIDLYSQFSRKIKYDEVDSYIENYMHYNPCKKLMITSINVKESTFDSTINYYNYYDNISIRKVSANNNEVVFEKGFDTTLLLFYTANYFFDNGNKYCTKFTALDTSARILDPYLFSEMHYYRIHYNDTVFFQNVIRDEKSGKIRLITDHTYKDTLIIKYDTSGDLISCDDRNDSLIRHREKYYDDNKRVIGLLDSSIFVPVSKSYYRYNDKGEIYEALELENSDTVYFLKSYVLNNNGFKVIDVYQKNDLFKNPNYIISLQITDKYIFNNNNLLTEHIKYFGDFELIDSLNYYKTKEFAKEIIKYDGRNRLIYYVNTIDHIEYFYSYDDGIITEKIFKSLKNYGDSTIVLNAINKYKYETGWLIDLKTISIILAYYKVRSISYDAEVFNDIINPHKSPYDSPIFNDNAISSIIYSSYKSEVEGQIITNLVSTLETINTNGEIIKTYTLYDGGEKKIEQTLITNLNNEPIEYLFINNKIGFAKGSYKRIFEGVYSKRNVNFNFSDK